MRSLLWEKRVFSSWDFFSSRCFWASSKRFTCRSASRSNGLLSTGLSAPSLAFSFSFLACRLINDSARFDSWGRGRGSGLQSWVWRKQEGLGEKIWGYLRYIWTLSLPFQSPSGKPEELRLSSPRRSSFLRDAPVGEGIHKNRYKLTVLFVCLFTYSGLSLPVCRSVGPHRAILVLRTGPLLESSGP